MQNLNLKQEQERSLNQQSIFFKETLILLDDGLMAIIKPLSYKHLQTILQLLENNQQAYARLYMLNHTIVEVYNIYTDTYLSLEDLSAEHKDRLYQEAENLSLITSQELEKLATAIDISLDKRYNSDNWKCAICKQRRGLQKARACPFIPEEDRRPFKTYVKGREYNYCPVADKLESEYHLENAMKVFELISRKAMPDTGGWYEQTAYAVLIGDIIKNKFDEAKHKAQEEAYKQT